MPAEHQRRKLPVERRGFNREFKIAGHEGTVTAGIHENGELGEVFIRMSKRGSTVRGLCDAIGVLTSIALQSGIPLRALVDKFKGSRFEPMGVTDDPEIPEVSSVLDYVFRLLELRFLPESKTK